MPSPIYQYVINLIMSLPIRRRPDVFTQNVMLPKYQRSGVKGGDMHPATPAKRTGHWYLATVCNTAFWRQGISTQGRVLTTMTGPNGKELIFLNIAI
jgi:hypothetical protein